MVYRGDDREVRASAEQEALRAAGKRFGVDRYRSGDTEYVRVFVYTDQEIREMETRDSHRARALR